MTAISRGAVAASLAAVLGLGLAACTQASDSGPEGGASSPSSAASSSISPSSSTDEQEGTPIRIRIGDQSLEATVWDNSTGRALLEQLPLSLSFEDLNGQEKAGHLDRELTMDGMPDGDDPQVGDLGYYAPSGNVVLYYGDVGRWDGIARIGRIHGNLSVISDQAGDFTATLEAAK
ncbi:cyclophilin-like fold protein [Streptomyces sp. NBC_01166]|uniref:cyclophilin-like fold protein n=1 Tax=Streptomyces sp. NBC_01166 TaxID=2903755 RepID=UPI00386D8F26|nr:cyclophilin-like fold protein [Streptomyces sp. NBC_01166]